LPAPGKLRPSTNGRNETMGFKYGVTQSWKLGFKYGWKM
jgi:hypothetical protein